MKLEVGMYVRTKKGIAKIKKIFSDDDEPYFEAKYETDTYLEIYYDSEYVSEDDIIKSSYNIIDILKVGDYVNGYKITEIIEKPRKCLKTEYKINLSYVFFCFYEKDIKSIVTHEQMEQMAYKVVE